MEERCVREWVSHLEIKAFLEVSEWVFFICLSDACIGPSRRPPAATGDGGGAPCTASGPAQRTRAPSCAAWDYQRVETLPTAFPSAPFPRGRGGGTVYPLTAAGGFIETPTFVSESAAAIAVIISPSHKLPQLPTGAVYPYRLHRGKEML